MSTPTIFDRIRSLEHLTPSETKIAQYLDKAYPLLALETVTSISERARVGRATVVRFISRLGYSSFAEFQQSLRKELLLKLEAAGSLRQGQAGQSKDSIDQFRLHCELIAKNLDEACRRIDEHTLQKCADRIAECSGSIYILGRRMSFGMAYLFSIQLSYLRDGVVLIDNLGGNSPNYINQMSSQDIIFAVFQSRYSRFTEQTAQAGVQRGSRLILLTDRELNPLSHLASFQLVAPSEGRYIFDSRCTGLAVLETLVNLVAVRYKNHLSPRLKQLETTLNDFNTFSTWGKPAKA